MNLPAASLGDWAGVAGVAISFVGLLLVWVQLRAGAATARAQATIQFQQAFRESRAARGRLLATFPVHEDMLYALTGSRSLDGFATWRVQADLTDEQKRDATAVINALNDVAQYVADGLSLRSALQQYHTIFVRAGMLLGPLIDLRNAKGATRNGVRVITLYNAGLAYHRTNAKHQGRTLALIRGDATLVLIDPALGGLQPNTKYEPSPSRWSLWVPGRPTVGRVVRAAERTLGR
jgi:hypothetical protein